MSPTGSKIGIVFNGSPMFTGDASSGESNIRKWLIENDYIESISVLPDRLFFNTDITTYVWILSNKKREELKGKIIFLNLSKSGTDLKKNLGDKGQYLTDETIQNFLEVYTNVEQKHPCKKIYDSKKFGYHRITVDFPELENGTPKRKKNGTLIIDSGLREIERVPLVSDPISYFEKKYG